jgi:hypothetical protein
MARKPWIADRQTALVGGFTAITVGALLLWDAYENRGVSRPFWTKLLPGA